MKVMETRSRIQALVSLPGFSVFHDPAVCDVYFSGSLLNPETWKNLLSHSDLGILMSRHQHHKSHPQHHSSGSSPRRKTFYRDWKFIVAVVLMLIGMFVYVFSMDESIVPVEMPIAPVTAPVAP